MDGGRYFAIRNRLEAVARGVSGITRRHGVDDSGLAGVDGQGRGPGRPLVLAVIGETNSGKSSLLNSLFGRAVCPVDALPDRGPAVWHGKTEPAETPPGLVWRELPQDKRLQGFEEGLEACELGAPFLLLVVREDRFPPKHEPRLKYADVDKSLWCVGSRSSRPDRVEFVGLGGCLLVFS